MIVDDTADHKTDASRPGGDADLENLKMFPFMWIMSQLESYSDASVSNRVRRER